MRPLYCFNAKRSLSLDVDGLTASFMENLHELPRMASEPHCWLFSTLLAWRPGRLGHATWEASATLTKYSTNHGQSVSGSRKMEEKAEVVDFSLLPRPTKST